LEIKKCKKQQVRTVQNTYWKSKSVKNNRLEQPKLPIEKLKYVKNNRLEQPQIPIGKSKSVKTNR
jgi:hypothetical protein